MKDGQPKAIYLSDYTVPAFLIEETHLDVSLAEDGATVRSVLKMTRNPEAQGDARLVLDGSAMLTTRSI